MASWWNSIDALTRASTGIQITIIACSIFLLGAGVRLSVLQAKEARELQSRLEAETKRARRSEVLHLWGFRRGKNVLSC